MRYSKLITLIIISVLFVNCQSNKKERSVEKIDTSKPNIIIIYADDLGLGDVSSYGSTELLTPNIDRIASEGIRFTNGYASSPTCTPSRYALLSGTYPFRKKNAQILQGNAPLLFELGKQTLPSMLKEAGYKTGVIGKWHLGLGDETLNWNKKVAPGPLEIGFDYAYIMASTNDRVPSVYVENHKIVDLDSNDPIEVSYSKNFEGEPTGKQHPELLKLHPSHGHDMSIHNGISRIGYMRGGKSALFIDEEMNDDFLKKSIAYINENKDRPFFLFHALHQPHVPRVPHPRFVGKSGLGARGDVILEADWSVGQLLDELEKLGLSENTIILFSSDNGPVLDDGYIDEAVSKIGNHTPSGGLRGGKYSLFDAGTHVPFMVRWKGTIKPSVSDALVSQIDFTASLAALVGQENTTPDSQNILDAFLGKSQKGRESLILGGTNITTFRKGNWILIPPHRGPKMTNEWVNIETGRDPVYQLYNVQDDPEQKRNLAETYPEKVKELLVALDKEKLCFTVLNTVSGQHKKQTAKLSFIAKNLEWKGVAVQDDNYTIWGCSPVQSEDGKTHLFAARWPEKNVDPAWRKSSEIAHYIADKPEGPFIFSDIAIQGTGKETWDKYAPHNPEIKKVGDQYVLLYIGNTDYNQPPHPGNQSIGMAISKSPYGPWEKVGKDGEILNAKDAAKWNYKSWNGVTNPAFIVFKGKYYLYFKSMGKDGLKYGLAIASDLEGPYIITDNPITSNIGTLEDGTVFYYKGYIYLLTTDNHGKNTGIPGGGTLWKSKDGLTFNLEDATIGYDVISAYYSDYELEKIVKIYGGFPKLMERPKILMIDGKPAYLYGPSGWNYFGGERVVCHVLKINLKE